MLADAIVVIHLLIVLFILAGPPLIYLGAALRWAWVKNWRLRILHLGAILFVAAESLLGITCPLTPSESEENPISNRLASHGASEKANGHSAIRAKLML
jgi:hypothetical protein